MTGEKNQILRLLLFAWAFLLVGIFCTYYAATQALWTDEIFSLLTAEEKPGRMIHLLSSYQPYFYDHPPLYFLLLREFLFYGNSPIVLRLMSLCSIALMVGLWSVQMLSEGFQAVVAAALALMMTLHPAIRFEATNARMYALVLVLTTIAMMILFRIPRAEGRRQIALCSGLAMLLAALVYTSYFGILFGVGVGFIGTMWVSQSFLSNCRRPQLLRTGLMTIAACFAGAALTLPWLPATLHLIHSEGTAEPIAVSRLSQTMTILHAFGGTNFGSLFIAVGWILLFVLNERRGTWGLLLAGIVIVPMALLGFFTPRSREIYVRYVIYAIPLLVAGAAVGWNALGKRFAASQRSASAFACLLLLLPTPAYFVYARSVVFAPMPDWWGAAKIIEANAQPKEFILTGGYLSGEELIYHLKEPKKYSFIHYVTDMDQFYVKCRDPEIVWYVNVAPLPEGFANILYRYFPYRVVFAGNRGIMTNRIDVFAKKPFKIPWDGTDAPHFEPITLDYEEAARLRQNQIQQGAK